MIKVAFIISRLNIGGPSIHVDILAKEINNMQMQSIIISGSLSHGEGDMSYLVKDYSNRHILIAQLQREISPWNDLVAFIKILKVLFKFKPQIVHTHMAKAGMLGRLAAFLTRIPVIIHTYHGHVFYGYFSRVKTKIFVLIEKILSVITDGIIVLSETQKNDICNKYKITNSKKINIIPLGIELDKLPDINDFCGLLRKKYNIAPNKRVIGIVGRITAIKNHNLFLEIASLLLSTNSDLHFLIIGDGELRDYVNYKINELGIEKNVNITGWVTNIAAIYANIDLLLLTSINEGTPSAIIEAMYYGIPVISTKVGGISDIINQNETGIIIDSFNAQDFIEPIQKLLQNDSHRDKIVNSAKLLIKNNFSAKRMVNSIIELYKFLLYH